MDWTNNEIKVLRSLLKQFGKNYVAIANKMKTKTREQIRCKVLRWIATADKKSIQDEDPKLYDVLTNTNTINNNFKYKRDDNGNLIYKMDNNGQFILD